jgi:PAS domain S-box-containing protein
VENPIRRVLQDGQIVGLANHTLLISRTGREIPIDDSGAPIMTSGAAAAGVVLVFRDVSERKRATDTARRLAAIVENSDDAIVGKTLDGIVTSWNRGAERLYGYSAQDMIGGPFARLIPPDRAALERETLDRVSAGSMNHYQTERKGKDGHCIKVSVTASPIRDEAGLVIGASVIERDITQELRREELMLQTQKMEAVGRLAGGVAHDFNNLLTVILGYASVAKRLLPPDDPLRGTITEILRAGEQASALTGQLLAFSRKQVTLPRVIDLGRLVVDMKDILQRLIGEDIDLAVTWDGSPCQVKVDPGQLTQVLMNLAANGRDAMPTGGKLRIEIRAQLHAREDLGHRGIRPAGRYIVLQVSDSGAGMDAETQAHIFEPFFTTKESGKGTGLGLATVYGIVQQNGGWIDVSSQVGCGAAFTIHLPSANADAAESSPPSEELVPRKAANILVVEDQAAILMLAEDALIEAGHRVLSASSGRAALELVEKRGEPIDILITDVVMPGMSGPELAAQLSGSRPGMLVLYVSGYTGDALVHRGVVEQGTSFLQKPFLPETLQSKVAELLRVDANARGAEA